jgi:hypothetical protein
MTGLRRVAFGSSHYTNFGGAWKAMWFAQLMCRAVTSRCQESRNVGQDRATARRPMAPASQPERDAGIVAGIAMTADRRLGAGSIISVQAHTSRLIFIAGGR